MRGATKQLPCRKKAPPRQPTHTAINAGDLDDVQSTPRLSIDGNLGPVKFAREINGDQSAYTYNCPVF